MNEKTEKFNSQFGYTLSLFEEFPLGHAVIVEKAIKYLKEKSDQIAYKEAISLDRKRVEYIKKKLEEDKYHVSISIDSVENNISLVALKNEGKSEKYIIISNLGDMSYYNVISNLKRSELSKYLKFVDRKAEIVSFKRVVFRKDGPRFHKFEVLKKDVLRFIYPELFYIDVNKFFNSYLKSNSSLVLLYGPPGTGKSKFLSLIAALNKGAYLLKGDIFSNISEAISLILRYTYKYYSKVNKTKFKASGYYLFDYNDDEDDEEASDNYPIFIFDDFDDLSKRDSHNTGVSLEKLFISELLSATDGLLPVKPKILISTNVELSNIDSAVIRPGRMFDVLHFTPLKKDYAFNALNTVIKRIDDDFEKSVLEKVIEYIKKVKKDEITHAEIGNFIEKGIFEIQNITYDYAKVDGVSILNSIIEKSNRRAGFI